MKKLLCIVLTATLLALSCATAVFADNALQMAAGTAEATAGESVDVALNVLQNPGISGIMITVTYDPAILRLDSFSGSTENFPGSYYMSGDGYIPFNITWTADMSLHTSFTGTGLFGTLHFTILEDAPAGETAVQLTYQQNSTFDVDFNDVLCTLTDGSVHVVEAEQGGWNFKEDSTLMLWEGDYATYVTGINTDTAEITGEIETTGGWSYAVQENSTGAESTGAVLQIMDASGAVVESYEVVFYGDVNGDGEVSMADAAETIAIAMYKSGYEWEDTYEDSQQYAVAMSADVDHDGEVSMTDVAEIIAAANYLERFNQQWQDETSPAILYDMD